MTLQRHRGLRVLFAAAGTAVLLLVLAVALFVVNGMLLRGGTKPRMRLTEHVPAEPLDPAGELRVVSYNIAKAFVYKGSLQFESPDVVRERLGRLAEAIEPERPDLVFLSETVRECGPCPVDQVAMLADLLGMHSTAFGENYNIGIPFFRLVGGNAILSRRPLEPVLNMDLAGRKPFYVTTNNRRALWCTLDIKGSKVLLAALHNDTFDPGNNLSQAGQLISFARGSGGQALLAGDFNARADSPSLGAFRESGLFSGVYDGPPTFPADRPERTIDFILGPAGWKVVEHRVIRSDASDHCPVLTVFRVP